MTFMSTSAVAFGEDLASTLGRIRAAGHTEIQIALGPRPHKGDVVELLAGMRESGVKFAAHANCPLGTRLLNQERDFTEIMANCSLIGIENYTLHAPRKRSVTSWKHFLAWAADKYMEACENGVSFAVETMYPAEAPYWLDSYDDVMAFTEWAAGLGWDKPMATDVAHLQICVEGGTWTEPQVDSFLRTSASLEFHFSDNDGVHDNHRPHVPGLNERIDKWVELASTHGADMIDEGRRRR